MAGNDYYGRNMGMADKSWRGFLKHMPGVGGGMYGQMNDAGGAGSGGRGFLGTAPGVPMRKPNIAQPLERAADAGRNGDTIIAHLNPQEAAMLAAMGGAGTRNPRTGLLEFYVSDNDAGPGSGPASSGDNEANDVGDNGVTGSTVGSGPAPGVGDAPGEDGTSAPDPGSVVNDMMESNATRNVVARNMLNMVPGVMMANVVNRGLGSIAEMLGATNESATAAQSVVGMGGPTGEGPSGDSSGPGYTDPVTGQQTAQAPAAPNPADAWTSPAYYQYAPAVPRPQAGGFLPQLDWRSAMRSGGFLR